MTTRLSYLEKYSGLTTKDQFQKLAVALVITFTLSACGGAVAKKVDDARDNITKDRSSTLTFVNSRDEMVSFYTYPNIMLQSIFQSEYKTEDVQTGEVSAPYTYKWAHELFDSQVGVQNTNSNNHKATYDIDLEDQEHYWAVTWLDGTDDKISVFKKNTQKKADAYTIRVFTNTAVNIFINGSSQTVTQAEKGGVTTTFEIDNCASGISIGDQYIDFCQQANFGESYLIVSKDEGGFIVGQE